MSETQTGPEVAGAAPRVNNPPQAVAAVAASISDELAFAKKAWAEQQGERLATAFFARLADLLADLTSWSRTGTADRTLYSPAKGSLRCPRLLESVVRAVCWF